MDKRYITCTNEDNISMDFRQTFSPYLLQNVDGIYEYKNTISKSDNTMTHGATFLGANVNVRNIVITLAFKGTYEEIEDRRDFLYELFENNSVGTFVYHGQNYDRSVRYRVEYVDVPSSKKKIWTATISLLCLDPFFEDSSDIDIIMAGWKKLFTFKHQFKKEGEELGRRIKVESVNIFNTSAIDGTGITITIVANGDVSNPKITHVQKQQSIQIGTDYKPLNLQRGDKLVITTHTNDKHVYLTQDGVTTDINNFLSEDSEFIQLDRGWNSIGYDASSGRENMMVYITYRNQYLGA